jgi:hypothetical protein
VPTTMRRHTKARSAVRTTRRIPDPSRVVNGLFWGEREGFF